MNTPASSRRESTLRHRELIVRESVQLFLSQGYDHTTIRQISEKTGLSVGSIYHLFRGKEEILAEYVKNIYGRDTLAPLQLTEKNLSDPVASIVEYACRIARKNESLGVELTRIIGSRFMPAWETRENHSISNYHVPDSFLRFVREAQRRNLLDPDVPAEEIVELVHITTAGILSYWLNLRAPFSMVEKIRTCLPRVLSVFRPGNP